ncbi:hypothetical protein ACF0H5_001182 [Mactra antiquata]
MESVENVCLVCHEHVEVYAIGRCDHPICFKCSTRMRALCDQFYCPICRADLPEVFFLSTQEKFGEMPMRKFIMNRKLKIQFENETICEKFEQLLEHKCKKCPDRYPEKSFKALRDHMRRVHTLFYCDLCLELKIFSSERKVYNRQDLAMHRRVGDKNDKSYKGHPNCQFCEERYLDKDELYKHLRKDHYFCHFCESLGSQEFYNDYDILKEHFRTDHYLCEEGECAEVEFTNAFRSDIDFKSHQAQCHSKASNNFQARQERKINIDINLVPRPNSRSYRGGRESRDEHDGGRGMGPRHQGHRGARGGKHSNVSYREKNDIDRAIQASLSTMKDDDMKRDVKGKPTTTDPKTPDFQSQSVENFPVLGGKSDTVTSSAASSSIQSNASVKSSLADRLAMSNNMSVQHGTLNDFPTLGASVLHSTSPKNVPPKTAPQSGNVNIKNVSKQKAVVEDFPELPSSKPTKTKTTGTWVKSNNNISERDKPAKQKGKSHTNKSYIETVYNVNDFPTLVGPSDTKAVKKWFISSKHSDPSPDNCNTSNKLADNNDYKSSIIDQFSPINIPDSPKDDRTKNKKKKMTDKVSKTRSVGSSIPANNSLDDIASLLITESSQTHNDLDHTDDKSSKTAQKSKKEKGKSKNKVDKVDESLENKKSLESKFEELNLYSRVENTTPTEVVKSEPVNFNVADDEFPSLGIGSAPRKPTPSSASRKVPPGFNNEVESKKSAAPPGFTKTVSYQPPPGFGSYNMAPVSQDIIPMTNDLSNFEYSQPDDFQGRNCMLIGAIQAFCATDPYLFTDFKQVSGEFRRSEIPAQQYYRRCEEILGENNFSEVFPELLALLPDIKKQQELLSVFKMSSSLKNTDKVLKISGKSKKVKGAWSVTESGFLSCPTCRQVLSRKDYNHHLSMHEINTDFPSLSNNTKVPSSKFPSGSWVKA